VAHLLYVDTSKCEVKNAIYIIGIVKSTQ